MLLYYRVYFIFIFVLGRRVLVRDSMTFKTRIWTLHYNKLSRRTQSLEERELEIVKSFPTWKHIDFEELETFLIIELGVAVASENLHWLYDNAQVKFYKHMFLYAIKCFWVFACQEVYVVGCVIEDLLASDWRLPSAIEI